MVNILMISMHPIHIIFMSHINDFAYDVVTKDVLNSVASSIIEW